MRSSRLSRRERRALRFGPSVSSVSSTPYLTSSLFALGAMASSSVVYADAVLADVVAPDGDSSPRQAQQTTAPRVTIVQPAYADLLKGNAGVVIAVDGSSTATKSVEMFVDGVSATNGPIPLSGLNSAKFDWKTSTVKDGLHRLVVRVTDGKGLRGEAETQVYTNNSRKRDTSAPTLEWKNVRNGQMLHGQADLQLEASDDFGLKYIVITVNPLDNPNRTPALRASLINRAPFVYSFDTTRLPDGVYVLNARGYDVLDNEGTTQRITFGVSNNGLNPTVVEQLNEVLASTKVETKTPATKAAATSTRTSTRIAAGSSTDTSTRAALNAKPLSGKAPQNTAPPKAVAPESSPVKTIELKSVAPKIAAPKVILPKGVSPKGIAIVSGAKKEASVRVAKVEPSIVVQAPSISQPSLTRISLDAPAAEAVVSAVAQRALFNNQVLQKLSQPFSPMRSSTPRLAALSNNLETSAPETSVSSANTPATPTKFVPQPGSVVSTPFDVSTAATRDQSVVQRFEKPRDTLRFATGKVKSVQSEVKEMEAPAATSLPTYKAVTATSGLINASPAVETGVGEYSLPTRASLRTPALRTSSLRTARLTGTVAHSSPSVPLVTSERLSLPMPLTAVSSHLASSHLMNAEMKTPQRMAALPTRRSNEQLSPRATLASNIGSGAPITVSPATLASLQTRGAAVTIPAVHIVKRGETLSALAAHYGLRAETLANVNGLKGNAILNIGQKLSLPRALKVAYKGTNANGDAQAFMVGSTGVAPFRFLFEQQGGTIKWDEAAQRITASNGARRVSINIGSREASVDDQKVMMDLAAFLLSGRTMVPVRFFEKAFDTRVEWEPATSRIYVAMSNDAALVR